MTAKPQKQTRQERSAQIGIALKTLGVWERCGVNVWDDTEVRHKIAKMRNLPTGIKPEWLPQTVPPGAEPIDGSIDGLVAELHACTDKHQAQTIKTKIDGLINAYKLREAAGKYVSKATVDEALIRIAAAVKAAILRMEADLPPQLEGADPPAMQRIIRGKVDEVMAMLSDESAKVWEQNEQPA